MARPFLHPLLDQSLPERSASAPFAGGVLRCRCSSDRVEVAITGDVAHNHACGCSRCWKPPGALFAVVAMVPSDHLKVTAHADKLRVVDEAAVIRRHACRGCGVHMLGRIAGEHAFKGLDFVHVELAEERGWQPPQFAAFVSSIIEQGYRPEDMGAVRDRLHALGLETYDCLSPPLMDAIAVHGVRQAAERTSKQAPGTPAAPLAEAATFRASRSPPDAAGPRKQGGVAGFFHRLLGG